ncbi:MAG: hypothetical protein C4288_00065 [Leptolyngbya sp. ERB_1_1]
MPIDLEPFGEPDCESELKLLGTDEYSKYYFYHTPFNQEALNRKVFLIIGRRGSGKTALSSFFSFQKTIPNATAIDVDEPAAFQQVMTQIAAGATQSREVAIPRLAKIWEFVIWSILFRQFQHKDPRIKAACFFGNDADKVSTFIRSVLKSLATKFLKTDNSLADELEKLLSHETIRVAKAAVLEYSKTHPVIVSIDTLENYDIKDESMMRATGALIQCASTFSREYAQSNIHLKLFVMAEIFPHLKEEIVLNTLKFVRNEVYLHWRPKDLMRLISWRFWRYLRMSNMVDANSPNGIKWEDHREVLKERWKPFFGDFLENEDGVTEKTFPYVLRHTQLRPRQLIVLCNSIAQCAQDRGTFPNFTPEDIILGIQQGEERLADEVFNSYSSVYPNAARIAEALSGMPLIFKGSELDKRAPQTASLWAEGDYSSYAFRQLVVELGIVGRVRQIDEKQGIIEADFEYATTTRLPILVTDECVIHPMFYKKLNIKKTKKLCVYPFPDHAEFKFEKIFGAV